MQIRRAEVDDAPAMARQMHAVVEEGRWLASEVDRSVDDLTQMFQTGLEAGHILLVLDDDGEILGAAGVHPTGVEGVHSLGMSLLAEHRGSGWGRRLLDAALAEAVEAGVRKIELEVFPDNPRAIALYVSAGFDVEGMKRDHYPRLDGTLRSALLMARFLRPG